MTEKNMQIQVDAAKAYEELMVASLFGEWAVRVADGAGIQLGDCVLDVACGTGVLAREVASRVGAGGSVVGLDPAPGMLEVARRLEPGVEWREGVAEALPFDNSSFDVVVSQFGFMFFRDREKAVQEILRVLIPGGRFAVAVWDSIGNNHGYADEVGLVERIAGEQAADGIRLPFVLGDREELVSLFADAAVTDLTVRTEMGMARFPGVRVMVEADLRGWLPLLGIHLGEEAITAILKDADNVLGRYVGEDGVATFQTSAHIVTGTKPERQK